MRLKVINGTLRDERLCDTCRFATIMKFSNGQERVFCEVAAVNEALEITGRVVECNGYRNKSEKTMREFNEIGWVLQTKGKQILGFKPPEKKDE